MLNKAKDFLGRNCPFLFKETMPVWLTIVVSLAAAFATYVFAPIYSRQFQIEDVRSAHLKETTSQLNDEIIELSQKVRRFDSSLVNKSTKSGELREDCLDLITKLQWRLVDLRVVLTHDDDGLYVTDLSNSIELLRIKLNGPVTPSYRQDVHNAMGKLGEATSAVLNRLYAKAALQG